MLVSACSTSKEVTKEITFSNTGWKIKQHAEVHGPGNNFWDSTLIVQDEKGIHFSIDETAKGVNCSEIISKHKNYGYGVYEIQINGRLDSLEDNTVFGVFLYQKKRKSAGEIDIEFTKWNDPKKGKVHYSIHNLTSKSPITVSKPYILQGAYTTHIIKWTPERLSFGSFNSHISYDKTLDKQLQIFKTEQKLKPKNYRFHFNFWKLPDTKPTLEKQSIIVKHFKYTALPSNQ
jgi:hypothetical protein